MHSKLQSEASKVNSIKQLKESLAKDKTNLELRYLSVAIDALSARGLML